MVIIAIGGAFYLPRQEKHIKRLYNKLRKNYWTIEKENISPKSKMIADRYLENLKLNNKLENTIKKYRSVLQIFLADCSKELAQLVADDVLDWINARYGDKKEKTIDLVLSVLSSFFQFCQAEKYVDRKLTKNRWRPRLPKSLPRYLNDAEVARLKIAAEKGPLRDRAILLFMLSSGCRLMEIAGLNLKDICMENRTALVTGKGEKVRHVHFNEETAFLLEKYIASHPQDKEDTAALFLNKFGRRLTRSGIYNLIKKIGAEAGLEKNFSPHSCRHTFATNMLARGADLKFVMVELGHGDPNTTRIYASIPSENMFYEYNRIME
jgi:integrase/recombinase XerD